ncbi:MAG: hypothetical protein J6Y94_05685, partial [Bacteriovoracaceae bacterium]|nr:hypothetical protein [Bacteriovoracaceae bacterium]
AAEQDRGQILQEAYTVAWSGEQDKSAKRKDQNKGKHKNKDSDPDRGEERPAQGAAKLAAALGPENTLLLARPLAQIIPVDVVVAGCPPTPQALAQGVRLLESMIKAGYRGQRPPV